MLNCLFMMKIDMKYKIGLVGLSIALLFVAKGLFFTADDTAHKAGLGDKISACLVAEKLVKARLKAPSSAEFPAGTAECHALQNDRTWTIASYVDSQNGFGAMLRTHFVAEMDYKSTDDSYYLIDLTFSE